MQVPPVIQPLCQAFLAGLKTILGSNLHSLILYGAVAFPDPGPIGDIDFHVILNNLPDKQQRMEIERLHQIVERDFPPLGGELDGYYILLAEARQKSPPRHILRPDLCDDSWALHRAHILAGRCIVLHGPAPGEIYLPSTWSELDLALQGELRFVERNLDTYPAYCILNLCRLVFSYTTGNVVISKAKAAIWACDALPQWQPQIAAARKDYSHQASEIELQFLRSEVHKIFDQACERIRVARDKR